MFESMVRLSVSQIIRVILIDDEQTIHLEIGDLLKIMDDIELVASGYDGAEAITLCAQHQPDVVLMDVSMLGMNGIEATRVITSRYPQTRILALTGLDDTRTVQAMLAAGASGYILKEAHPEELASTIRTIHDGKSVFSTEVVKPLFSQAPATTRQVQDFGLTRREMEILSAMAAGLNNTEVAEKLYISTATVRFHLRNIIEKLGAENRSEALVIAVRYNLI